jgi:hypothetical protein
MRRRISIRPFARRRRDDSWDAFEREFRVWVGEPAAGDAELRRLARLLHEALALCEHVDALLPEIRDDDGPPGELAHRCPAVVARLHAMRTELLAIRAPRLRRPARQAETIVNFYAQYLPHALALLVADRRDERIAAQLERLGPATWATGRLGEIADEVDSLIAAAPAADA